MVGPKCIKGGTSFNIKRGEAKVHGTAELGSGAVRALERCVASGFVCA